MEVNEQPEIPGLNNDVFIPENPVRWPSLNLPRFNYASNFHI